MTIYVAIVKYLLKTFSILNNTFLYVVNLKQVEINVVSKGAIRKLIYVMLVNIQLITKEILKDINVLVKANSR